MSSYVHPDFNPDTDSAAIYAYDEGAQYYIDNNLPIPGLDATEERVAREWAEYEKEAETYEQFVTSRVNRLREELDTIEALLLNRRKTTEYKLELAQATDVFHVSVHGVIGLFEMSNTPASLLQAEIDEREATRLDAYWSRFDED